MRAAYLVLAFALLAGLAGCGKGPHKAIRVPLDLRGPRAMLVPLGLWE
jgi:hypothetical protein